MARLMQFPTKLFTQLTKFTGGTLWQEVQYWGRTEDGKHQKFTRRASGRMDKGYIHFEEGLFRED